MGVKNLMKIIKEYSPEAITYRKLSEFKGQTWAIDASIFCYKFMYNSKSKKPNNHISGFYSLFNLLYKNGIKCILIFDGEAPPLKKNTIEDRSKIKQNLKEKVSNLIEEGNVDEASRLQKRIITFAPNTYEDIYMLCKLMDVPVYRAKYEADYLCSKLYSEGFCQAVVSDDTDFLMYKGENVIRNLDYTDEIEHINLKIILNKFNISYKQFVDLCILLGTDFNDSIKGYGKVTAINYVKAHDDLSSLINIMPYNYTEIKDWILNIFQWDDINHINNITNTSPNINWDELCKILPEKCNYRVSTIQKHRLNFVFTFN